MPFTYTAPFAQTPKTANCVAAVPFSLSGVTSLSDDTPGNTVILLTAGGDGALVTSVRAITRATNTATMGALFLRKSLDPAGKRSIVGSVSIAAQTLSTSTAIAEYPFSIASETSPMRLQAGDELHFGIAVAQSSGITATAQFVNF